MIIDDDDDDLQLVFMEAFTRLCLSSLVVERRIYNREVESSSLTHCNAKGSRSRTCLSSSKYNLVRVDGR